MWEISKLYVFCSFVFVSFCSLLLVSVSVNLFLLFCFSRFGLFCSVFSFFRLEDENMPTWNGSYQFTRMDKHAKKDASKPRRKKDSSLRTLRGITNNELLNGFGQKLWSICGSIRDWAVKPLSCIVTSCQDGLLHVFICPSLSVCVYENLYQAIHVVFLRGENSKTFISWKGRGRILAYFNPTLSFF